jgi:hypothetical protein
MSTPANQSKRPGGVTGVAVVAGLLIGIGVGLLVGNVAAGLFLGLGGGFAGMMVLRVMLGDW